MKVVKVYGALRKKLGQCRFEFEADTPAQALKALCVNFPWLTQWLIDSEQDGVGYRVTISKEKITDQNSVALLLPWSEQEVFSITPVLTGAGSGAGKILAGVGLIALAIVMAPLGAGFFGLGAGAFTTASASAGVINALSAASTILGTIGTSLVLTGVAQILSPSPAQSLVGFSTTRGQEAARFESFSFSGIVNTAKQGLPVPIVYGRTFTGSAVLSSGFDVDQLL
jgi:predicted phage tail protein